MGIWGDIPVQVRSYNDRKGRGGGGVRTKKSKQRSAFQKGTLKAGGVPCLKTTGAVLFRSTDRCLLLAGGEDSLLAQNGGAVASLLFQI